MEKTAIFFFKIYIKFMYLPCLVQRNALMFQSCPNVKHLSLECAHHCHRYYQSLYLHRPLLLQRHDPVQCHDQYLNGQRIQRYNRLLFRLVIFPFPCGGHES